MSVDLIIQTLKFSPSETEGRTDIEITLGDFAGVKYNYGRTWFPDESQPVLSFEYDIVGDKKPNELIKGEFEQLIGNVLMEMLKKAIDEQSVVYSGGTDEVESPKIFTGV